MSRYPGRHRRTDRTAARLRAVLVTLVAGLVALAGLTVTGPSATAAPAPLRTVIGSKLLGRSVAGRPIVAYHVGDPRSRVKAVLVGQMHGDEHAGVIVAQSILHGPPVKGIDLWVVPTMNPDGDVRHTRQNLHGVDLNRNWPDIWAPLGGMFYSGPHSLSEPETRAMYRFVAALRPTHMVVLHQPLYGVDTTDGGARNIAFRNRLARYLGMPLKPFTCGGVCHGSMTGWVTTHQSGSAITIEYGSGPSLAQLTRVSARGIIAALGGSYDAAAAHNPVGHVDAAAAVGSTVRLAGWAFDPDSRTSPITVRVLEGSTVRWQSTTSGYRGDVNRRFGAAGNHGFDARFAAADGRHVYCVQSINVGPGTGDPKACATLTVDGAPKGNLDSVSSADPGTVRLVGWMFDPDAVPGPGQVQVSVDGVPTATATADLSRPDVAAFGAGANHGFVVDLTGQAGTHAYCASALNQGPPHADVPLGCVSLTVS